MAHINRYTDYYSKSEFSDMFFNGDFILQFNAESALSHSGLSLMKKVIKGGYGVVFGCDIHDPAKVSESGLDKTLKFIDKLGADVTNELNEVERSLI